MSKQVTLIGKIGPAFGGVTIQSWGQIRISTYDAHSLDVALQAMAANILEAQAYAEWSGRPGPALGV